MKPLPYLNSTEYWQINTMSFVLLIVVDKVSKYQREQERYLIFSKMASSSSSSLSISSWKSLNLNHKSLSSFRVKLPPSVSVKLPPSDSDSTSPQWMVGRAAAVLIATSLCMADPAIAFKVLLHIHPLKIGN